jgi:anti-sigma regulatory factor (Ser/Thr protein kinase)
VTSLLEPGSTENGHLHAVQFYEGDADLVSCAGAYLREALDAGGAAIVIATEAHRRAFASRLGGGTVRFLDAEEVLERFMRDGEPDRDAFFTHVGGIVREAAASGGPVHAFGEMVALLWEAGDVVAAIELETLWNELAAEVPFALYCGYRSATVAGHDHGEALQRVCGLHTVVERSWEFPCDLAAPARARRLLTDALESAGHGGRLLADARLVITELAANAVEHARSPFSVSLRDANSTIRIRMRDASPALPELREESSTLSRGRGLRLVSALAAGWGVEPSADG